jgi:6-phosphofructokinase 1
MEVNDLDFTISKLGECRIPSPMSGAQFVSDEEHVLYHSNLRKVESFLA